MIQGLNKGAADLGQCADVCSAYKMIKDVMHGKHGKGGDARRSCVLRSHRNEEVTRLLIERLVRRRGDDTELY